ncbi:hypothetical protein JTB14_032252 [Gonioctena quinquepunctata]|nr:hypothetical protein JTB14_032252 [Gonioctena quinquepunctata]
MGIHEYENSVKEKFKLFEEQNKELFNLVYTDASKIGKRVGYGIYMPQQNFCYSARLKDNTNVCEAETIAVQEAMRVCLERNMTSNYIITDSKSALDKISRQGNAYNTDYITMNIKQMAYLASLNDTVFRFTWIPGHSKIEGNEKADQLAKIGTGKEK